MLAARNLVATDRWYVPANLATAAALVGLALAGGTATAADLGLTLAGAPTGLGWGALAAATVIAAAALPATRPLFCDRRMAGVGGRGTAWRAAVRIPLGTVVLEEVAFRGILPLYVPAVAAAVLFGLWHIVPTARTLRTNGLPVRASTLGAAVAVTFAAGLGFHALRAGTGGLLAPAIVHAAITSTATVASFVVLRAARRATM